MPVNLNAMMRIKVLDKLLSRNYGSTMLELQEEVIKELKITDSDYTVSLRQIQKDIKAIQEEPFNAKIAIEKTMTKNEYASRDMMVDSYRYEDPSFAIFKKPMTDDEKYLLTEALDIVGQFDGIPGMEQLDKLKNTFGIEDHEKIVDFAKNPMDNDSSIFGMLFYAISHKIPVDLIYHKFENVKEKKSVLIHPYLLKEYNRRWYVFCGADDTGKILNFALDRVDDAIFKHGLDFKKCKEDLIDMFDEIIGVSFYEDKPCINIDFWVSEKSMLYLETNPPHDSLVRYAERENDTFHKRYPSLAGGHFYRITCRQNQELYKVLLSYGKDLVVLQPDIRIEMKNIIKGMMENYMD